MRDFVAVKTDGEIFIHVPDTIGNYGTLCGISIDDDEDVGRVVALPKNPRITCKTCIAIIRAAKAYRNCDLEKAI